ncbi:MAG: replicative DNA helicase [Gammaproteobacteria bacterium]|nr:replicative DNA helicase [Gammaproteobacteria bacterium]
MPESKILASKDAEQSILGSVFYDESTIKLLNDRLIVSDFYYLRHQYIFDAMLTLFRQQTPIDATTVITYLEDSGKLNDCGGAEYILELTDSVPSVTNLIHYIDIVKDKAVERDVVRTCNDIIQLSNQDIPSSRAFLDDVEKRIYNATSRRTVKDMVPIFDILDETRRTAQENSQKAGYIIGLPTGYTEIDNATLGLQPSELIIIAARPSVGKTTFALNIATKVSERQSRPYVAFFSLEMSLNQLGVRLLAAKSNVDQTGIKTGKFKDEKAWEKINWAIKNLQDVNLFFDDSGSTTVQDVRSICRKRKSEGKLDLVVIDYLQLLSTSEKYESRTQQVGEISRVLKEMSRELKVPVIALSQLSRASGDNGKPSLVDLRESGSIEQDADIVIFLYREVDKSTGDVIRNVVNCSIGKNRNGRLADFQLVFNGSTSTFENHKEGEEV